MKAILEALSSPGWTNLVLALLHSVWLGVCWVLVLAGLLRRCGNDPERRYRYSVFALGGLVLSVLIAWSVQERDWHATAAQPGIVATGLELDSTATVGPRFSQADPSTVASSGKTESKWMSVLALVWAGGVVFMMLRLFVQVMASSRVRQASQVMAAGPLFDLLKEVQVKIGCTRLVKTAVNHLVTVPSVIGVWAPVILFPASMLTGVPGEQMRAILLHELAHIRRHDYLVNLLQQVIEALLFFNPAVWWINRQIRLERESCCDLTAARLTSEQSYATALAQFAERAHSSGSPLQLAFPGDRQSSTLLERMRRLLVAGYQPVVRLPWHSSLAVLCCAGLLLLGAWRGTRLAVAFAADILTAEERIDKIAEIKSQIGPVEASYTEADDIVVAGRIRTEDGGLCRKDCILILE